MALTFSDVAAAFSATSTPQPPAIPVGLPPAFAGLSGYGSVSFPPLSPGQGLMLRSWMATASNFIAGATLTAAQIGRLVQVWAYNLGCSMPQIITYAANNQ